MKRISFHVTALAVAASLLVGGMAVSPAWAYFTDSHETEGGIEISVEPSTEITETFDENGKHVTIINTSKTVPVWVRAKVYASANNVKTSDTSGTNWTFGDDGEWWYWDYELQPGKTTDPLDVKITFKEAEKTVITFPDGTTEEFINETHDGENFNVVVVYEAVPVQGTNPQDADWHLAHS